MRYSEHCVFSARQELQILGLESSRAVSGDLGRDDWYGWMPRRGHLKLEAFQADSGEISPTLLYVINHAELAKDTLGEEQGDVAVDD